MTSLMLHKRQLRASGLCAKKGWESSRVCWRLRCLCTPQLSRNIREVDRQDDVYLIRIVDREGMPVIPLRRFADRQRHADRKEYQRLREAAGQAASRRCAPAGIKVGRGRTVF